MTDQPEVLVTVTRYTVSVLPADDINHRYFALSVELTPRGWVVHDGHSGYDGDAGEHFGETHRRPLADLDDALALARWLIPSAPQCTARPPPPRAISHSPHHP